MNGMTGLGTGKIGGKRRWGQRAADYSRQHHFLIISDDESEREKGSGWTQSWGVDWIRQGTGVNSRTNKTTLRLTPSRSIARGLTSYGGFFTFSGSEIKGIYAIVICNTFHYTMLSCMQDNKTVVSPNPPPYPPNTATRSQSPRHVSDAHARNRFVIDSSSWPWRWMD